MIRGRPNVRYLRSAKGVGDSLFTVTANTNDGAAQSPVDSSNSLVVLLLGAALGAGVVTLIFTWK